MIKKEHHHEFDKKNKNKPFIHAKYIDQQTGSDTPKKTSFKLRFIQWLKQLPLDERYLAVKVNAPGFSKKIQETLIDLQNEPIQQQKKDLSISKRISPRQAKQIIQSLVLISDGQEYFDNIGFDFTYIQHPDKLYQLLVTTLSQQQKQMYQTDQYQIQNIDLEQAICIVEKSQSREELTLAIISFLRAEIFIKYEQKRSINLQQQRNRKKEFSMFWRNLSQEYKRKILLLNKEDYFTLSNFLGDKKIYLTVDDLEKEIHQLAQLQKNEFCNKIFKCKLKKSLTYFTDYHELVYKLWKVELNKKKRKLRTYKNINPQKSSTSLNRNSTIQVSQKPVKRIINKNQKQYQKVETIQRQKSRNNSSSNNLVNQKSSKNLNSINNNNNSNQQNQKVTKNINNANTLLNTQNQKSSKSNFSQNSNLLTVPQNNQNTLNPPTKRKRNRNRRKKSVSAESKETNTTSHKFQKQQKQEYQRKIQQQTSIASQQVIKIQSSILLTQSTLPCKLNLNVEDTVNLQISTQQISQIKFPTIDFQAETFAKVKIDIQQYSDLINQEANEFYQRRVIAYQRIQFMLGMWKIPIKLFGSCASGITIKNSDIDIAVDNSILNYFLHLSETHRLKGALQQLEQLLQQQPWVTGLKLIKTAAIPLIKLKVNTSIKFASIPGFQIYEGYIDSLSRDHLSSGQIHIDLTIQTINKQLQCNHLGIISTDQINNWLRTIKSLHSIVIIVKNYLTKTNLNITYEGGLNTYSMICMIVAYIRANQLEQETDVVKVFEKILKFYAFQFDEKTTGIDPINSTKEIFYSKLKLTTSKSSGSSQDENKLPGLTLSKSTTQAFCKADLQIKDPLNNGKIMTKNCYSFPKIRQIFQKMYKACFQEQNKKLQNSFKQQFKAKGLNTKQNLTLTQNSKQVRQLLNECKLKLGNPFLTLFE